MRNARKERAVHGSTSRRAARRPWKLVATAAAGVLVVLGAWLPASSGVPAPYLGDNLLIPNDAGGARTFSAVGKILFANPFFLDLGTNGRTCATCHVPRHGWTLVPDDVERRFNGSGGQEPLFRPVDGSVSPDADVSTLEARRRAYALLRSRGLIRVGLPIPAGAQFVLEAVDDPYGHASAQELSLFRRPLPTTNLRFLATVMWDGRETAPGATMVGNLAHQAITATNVHAEGARPLTRQETDAIVELTTALFTTQSVDVDAGLIRANGRALSLQPFSIGMNTSPFDPEVFSLFRRWRRPDEQAARLAVARGEEFFNHRPFGGRSFTCSTCHTTPNAGGNSAGLFFDTGVSRAGRRQADVPLYTLRCPSTGTRVRTTDPGRALVTGRCADIGRFKVPTLRALATRSHYFHDGSAATLDDVLSFYEQRFGIGFTGTERDDLLRFLRAL